MVPDLALYLVPQFNSQGRQVVQIKSFSPAHEMGLYPSRGPGFENQGLRPWSTTFGGPSPNDELSLRAGFLYLGSPNVLVAREV